MKNYTTTLIAGFMLLAYMLGMNTAIATEANPLPPHCENYWDCYKKTHEQRNYDPAEHADFQDRFQRTLAEMDLRRLYRFQDLSEENLQRIRDRFVSGYRTTELRPFAKFLEISARDEGEWLVEETRLDKEHRLVNLARYDEQVRVRVAERARLAEETAAEAARVAEQARLVAITNEEARLSEAARRAEATAAEAAISKALREDEEWNAALGELLRLANWQVADRAAEEKRVADIREKAAKKLAARRLAIEIEYYDSINDEEGMTFSFNATQNVISSQLATSMDMGNHRAGMVLHYNDDGTAFYSVHPYIAFNHTDKASTRLMLNVGRLGETVVGSVSTQFQISW